MNRGEEGTEKRHYRKETVYGKRGDERKPKINRIWRKRNRNLDIEKDTETKRKQK